jgi:exo-beta-1,3-glucanase (GH17 family)
LNRYKQLNISPGKAICYSGFREGQSPDNKIYPSYSQVKEDLLILDAQWDYIRLYSSGRHAEIVLQVIKEEGLNIRVMLGAYIAAEMNNFACPWGAVYSEKVLIQNKKNNLEEIEKLIKLADKYPDIIFSLSAGNEATVEWTDHFVPVKKVIEYVRMIKSATSQPVTFCENYVPWQNKLIPLIEYVDFISIHTYPVWEYKDIHDALEYTKENYYSIAEKYPGKPVMITEAGWTTNSNGRGINSENVSEEFQEIYYNDLMSWTEEEGIIAFVFEAFDEPWKGSLDKYEPEKHWGLFYENRKPKKVMKPYYPDL